jgi:hypothetical protein
VRARRSCSGVFHEEEDAADADMESWGMLTADAAPLRLIAGAFVSVALPPAPLWDLCCPSVATVEACARLVRSLVYFPLVFEVLDRWVLPMAWVTALTDALLQLCRGGSDAAAWAASTSACSVSNARGAHERWFKRIAADVGNGTQPHLCRAQLWQGGTFAIA